MNKSGVADSRKKLKKGQTITLYQMNTETGMPTDGAACFEIISDVAETKSGGTAICYDARCGQDTGRLKELYPADNREAGVYYHLQRSPSGALKVAPHESGHRFQELFEDFVASYRAMNRVKEENRNNRQLNNYMPSAILYCSAENGVPCTAYVWYKDDFEGISFDEYIREIHRRPKENGCRKLYNVVRALETLCDFLIVLHRAELLHLDIKPSNFLFSYDADKNIDTGKISVFDLNSVCRYGSGSILFSGTEGFSAPELFNAGAELSLGLNMHIKYSADIYSVGAVLYNALFSTARNSAKYDVDVPLDTLQEKIAACPFICYSSCRSDIKIQYRLLQIFKKTLAYNTYDRYACCEELKKDLAYIAKRLLGYAGNNELSPNERLAVVDKDYCEGVDATAVIQNLLYEYPLYCNEVRRGEQLDKTVRVLTVGAGAYAQAFIDQALQCGQMVGRYLDITAVSDDGEDAISYLTYRPELENFVCVNRAGTPPQSGMYADLNFVECDIMKKSVSHMAENVLNGKEPDYIFVALGDAENNEAVAEQLCSQYQGRAFVCYTASGNKQASGQAVPVFTDVPVKTAGISDSLEQMAFNAHLLWSDRLNLRMRDVWQEFKKPYNYNSSLALALSVKYKLYSIGIDISDADRAAAEFQKRSLTQADIYDELINLEHKRWVLEKVCQGWRCRRDLHLCLTRPHNDKARKEHTCIVKADDKVLRLQSEAYQKNACEKWDTANDAELAALDELDRMSVLLHREYKKEAERIKERNLLGADILKIQNAVLSYPEAEKAFAELYACLQRILSGTGAKAKMFDALAADFEATLGTLPQVVSKNVNATLELVKKNLSIVLKAESYTDFKKNDLMLVLNIPFVLTYSAKKRLVKPLHYGGAHAVFANVAAAAVINPVHITFVATAESDADLQAFTQAVKQTEQLLQRLNLFAGLSYILLCGDACIKAKAELLKTAVKAVVLSGENESVTVLLRALGKARIDAVETDDSTAGRLLKEAADMVPLPQFTFDLSTGSVSDVCGCDFVSYIVGKRPYLRIEDVFVAGGYQSRYSMPESGEEYRRLWRLYQSQPELWERLVSILAQQAERQDTLICLSRNATGSRCVKKYPAPAFTYYSVSKLMKALHNIGVIGNEFSLRHVGVETLEVTLEIPEAYVAAFDSAFSNPYLLAESREIEAYAEELTVTVKVNRLTSGKIELYSEPDAEKIKTLLRALAAAGFLLKTPGEEAFTYASYGVKSLLTRHGALAVSAVYQACLEGSVFDDLACDVVLEDAALKVAFDIVATKGSSCYFIQCEPKKAAYAELQTAAKHFGVNATAVVLTSSDEELDLARKAGVFALKLQREPEATVRALQKIVNRNN